MNHENPNHEKVEPVSNQNPTTPGVSEPLEALKIPGTDRAATAWNPLSIGERVTRRFEKDQAPDAKILNVAAILYENLRRSDNRIVSRSVVATSMPFFGWNEVEQAGRNKEEYFALKETDFERLQEISEAWVKDMAREAKRYVEFTSQMGGYWRGLELQEKSAIIHSFWSTRHLSKPEAKIPYDELSEEAKRFPISLAAAIGEAISFTHKS